jgi:hypothetical protein
MPFDDDSELLATATEESRELDDAQPVPAQLRRHLTALADTYGLPSEFVRAGAQTESGFNTGKTQTKPGASRDAFAPDNRAYGVLQVRDDQIGKTMRAPDGSSFQIGENIKSDWKANAQAGVALLAQHYQLADLENPFGSEQERAQQAYAGYSGGAPFRDRYLQTLPYNDLPAHPDDRAFLKNFLRSQTYGDHQDPREQKGSRTMEYRFGEDRAPAQTMEIRPGSDRFANASDNGRAYELGQSSQQSPTSATQGTTGQSSSLPLPSPLQRLKENPGNLFFGDRGASNSTPGSLSPQPRFSDQSPSQGTAPRPSLLNLAPFLRSALDTAALSGSSVLPGPLQRLKENPGDLFQKPVGHETKPGEIDYGDSYKQGGSRNWRNNNPGNMAFSNWTVQHGAIGRDSAGFAIFPTLVDGEHAQGALLASPGYAGLSLDQAIRKWTSGDPQSVQDAYVNSVVQRTGFGPNTRIGDLSPDQLSKLKDAMKVQEGWKEGNVTRKWKSSLKP